MYLVANIMSVLMKDLIFLLLLFFENVWTERDTPCTTPNGENATCIPAVACQIMVEALLTGDDSVSEFAQQSLCGFDTEPLICCGTLSFLVLPKTVEEEPVVVVTRSFTSNPTLQKDDKEEPVVLINRSFDPELEADILANFKTNELPDRTVCGLDKSKNRIVGGEATQISEFPWVAALEYKSNLDGTNAGIRCGGSIINNRYVLTAAHCLRHVEFELSRAWLGEWKISTDPDCQAILANTECAEPVQKIEVKEKFVHPFYSKRSKRNDIGLIRLEKDVKYTDYIRPICLPPVDLPEPPGGSLVTVSGWGTTENDTVSDIKLKVEVPLISHSKCVEKLQNRSISTDHLCAGGEKGKDSCKGDSGGPLMRTFEDKDTQQKQWYQEGVVSWGIACGHVGHPAIYTRVSKYIIWILNNIKDD